ncbi:Biotin synthase [compost metagenome]
MSDELQALCFFAGANSIFVGDTLLTADNPGEDKDALLFNKLNLRAEVAEATPCRKPVEARAQEQAA